MKREEFEKLMTDYVTGNCNAQEVVAFELFLKNNPQYNEEVVAMKMFMNAAEEEVETSASMDMKFYAMLNAEEQKTSKPSLIEKLQGIFSMSRRSKQFAYTFAILAVGFFVGNRFQSNKETTATVTMAKNETENVRSQLVLTLLDQPSVNKRLQAVNEVSKLNDVTEAVTKALFYTLNNDANVNVRLSAIEALSNYTKNAKVREGLIASIIHQKSPMVQIALADLMVKLQEKKAVKSFKKLIKEEDVNESAKQRMQESIQQII